MRLPSEDDAVHYDLTRIDQSALPVTISLRRGPSAAFEDFVVHRGGLRLEQRDSLFILQFDGRPIAPMEDWAPGIPGISEKTMLSHILNMRFRWTAPDRLECPVEEYMPGIAPYLFGHRNANGFVLVVPSAGADKQTSIMIDMVGGPHRWEFSGPTPSDATV